ncbi:MAG: hypothetical protein AAB315_05035, partial [Pseudomonadota bacterium]
MVHHRQPVRRRAQGRGHGRQVTDPLPPRSREGAPSVNINATLIGQMISFALLVWFTMKFVWP